MPSIIRNRYHLPLISTVLKPLKIQMDPKEKNKKRVQWPIGQQPGQRVWLSTQELLLPVPRENGLQCIYRSRFARTRARWFCPPVPHHCPGWYSRWRPKLLAAHNKGRGRRFLVDWKGYRLTESSWVPASFLNEPQTSPWRGCTAWCRW